MYKDVAKVGNGVIKSSTHFFMFGSSLRDQIWIRVISCDLLFALFHMSSIIIILKHK